MSLKILRRDEPRRCIALVSSSYALIFRHGQLEQDQGGPGSKSTPPAQCMVEFSQIERVDLSEYKPLRHSTVCGTLGLINIDSDVFVSVITHDSAVATVRQDEHVRKIGAVEFYCINRSDFDYSTFEDSNYGFNSSSSADTVEHFDHRDIVGEHPCLSLKKVLGDGTFYYSVDFDLTNRLQTRFSKESAFDADSLDEGFLWNSYMIQPLVQFRSRLIAADRTALDESRILTSAIRGYVSSITIPASSCPISAERVGLPSTLSLISRLSCRRAGTRFNSRGLDDDGFVANFVETETVYWFPSGLCFSYAQIRGSIPVFWEQSAGLLPQQQKIQIIRSVEATQPAFNKHFEALELKYGNVHVLNLLSRTKFGEVELTGRYNYHIRECSLNGRVRHGSDTDQHRLLQSTQFDFHAETRELGYEAARSVWPLIHDSAESFVYFLADNLEDANSKTLNLGRVVAILQQEGVFRTNCLDCLDRTNLVQTIISQMALQLFLNHRGEQALSDFWMRHSTLWADNGDALSRIYAGTGALKTSFTRHGKMSIAGALADARKSAARLYINNFADKGRQNVIDTLLGRLVNQRPVQLCDPINDYVCNELTRRTKDYTSFSSISIWAGTFNLNGKGRGVNEDLSAWICPYLNGSYSSPDLVAVGFQEIVELSPQQIMNTDPARRLEWELTVTRTLNEHAKRRGEDEYVLLRSGQLVGAALMVFVRLGVLSSIKNVEGAVKKTGMSGIAGNKGAVSIRMDFANTRLCFVTAHLAAGFANYEERNRDYQTISHGIRFQRNRTIEDHDSIIWLGDFNYRIGLSDDAVRKYIQVGELATLYQNDQLNIQMVAGHTFPFYTEARIHFLPTYKYNNGTDEYDTSEKARIPAWCDRILWKGSNLKQLTYNTAPLRFSDHRPVYATFHCTVKIEDASKKETLSKSMYHQRREEIGEAFASGQLYDYDDSEIVGYDSIVPGLPPASSERQKWWLNDGRPARSKVSPPIDGSRPNPKRLPNPFIPTKDPEWVLHPEVTDLEPQVSTRGLMHLGDGRVAGARSGDSRRMEPSIVRSPSMTSTSSSGPRKLAPPVPRKPVVLSNTDLKPELPKRHSTNTLDGDFSPPPQHISGPVSKLRPELSVRPNEHSRQNGGNELSTSVLRNETLMDEDSSEAKSFPVLRPSKPSVG